MLGDCEEEPAQDMAANLVADVIKSALIQNVDTVTAESHPSQATAYSCCLKLLTMDTYFIACCVMAVKQAGRLKGRLPAL